MSEPSPLPTIKDKKDKIIKTIATITEGLLAKDGELVGLIEQKTSEVEKKIAENNAANRRLLEDRQRDYGGKVTAAEERAAAARKETGEVKAELAKASKENILYKDTAKQGATKVVNLEQQLRESKLKDKECGDYIEEINTQLASLEGVSQLQKITAKLKSTGGKSVKAVRGGKKMKKAKKSRARRKGKK